MKTKLTALSIATVALLAAGASLSSADDQCASGCIKFTPELGLTGSMTLDAGGYSFATREHLTQATAYLEAHVEQPDGRVHPAFGANPRGVYIFKTMGGRYVVRIVEIPFTEFARPLGN
jgi:hypothetical protein